MTLEAKVRPIITPMIISMAVKKRCVALDRSSQLCVARWAVKTAMVVAFPNKPHLRYFTQAERRALMDGEVSNVSGAHVWIGCFANTNDGAKGTMSSLKQRMVLWPGTSPLLR